jgi:hypothetical protein
MPRGGSRQGAGRPAGAQNRKTVEQVAAIEAEGLTPLEYLTSVYRDEAAEQTKRIDAAKAAAPYVHARLNSVELKGDPDNPVAVEQVRRVIVRPGD